MGNFNVGEAEGRSMPKENKLNYREQVETEISYLEQQLERKKKMLKMIDENPAISEFINLAASGF